VEITEVKIFLREKQDLRLKAYATITFDDAFVVRDLRVIEGKNGLFVAMPSNKMRLSCPRCNRKNVIGSKFCNFCGSNIENLKEASNVARSEEHRDIAHPITSEAREYIQKVVLESYEKEKAANSSGTEEAPPAAE
jgi:stage V sporulation protein G